MVYDNLINKLIMIINDDDKHGETFAIFLGADDAFEKSISSVFVTCRLTD